MANFISEYPEFGAGLLSHYGDFNDAKRAAEDSYCGCYDSVADYAQELTEQITDIPQNLQYYIDYEGMARDMEMGGDIFTIETGYQQVHIFWSC